MPKGDVLDLAGNPKRTQRWQGKDRWIYEFPISDDRSETKEVHFSDGLVVYHGDPVLPSVSAEEQDRRNDESNRAIDKGYTIEYRPAPKISLPPLEPGTERLE